MAAPISFAAMAERKTEDQPLKVVQLDAHVVLKIVKHCKEGFPTLVTGQLLGLDVGQTLEVTDCFPFPVRSFSSFYQPRFSCIEAALIWVCCLLSATMWVLGALADVHKHAA